jgi:hypothetical protein
VALDLVLPYGVAFKIVTTLGLLALPAAVYFHARAMTLGRHVSLVTAGSAVVFVFYESFTIYGGNVASTLAGEFSYAWSFSLSLVYLGLLMKAVRDDKKYAKWAALALALTALSHVLTTIVIVFASLFVLLWKGGVWRTVFTWVWGFSIAAFWALPLLIRIGFSSDMAWQPLSRWEEIFPVEVWLLLPLAIAGAVWAMRRTKRAGPMIAATLLPIIYYPLPNILPELLPNVFGERWKLWNGRLLPYWYFGIAFFAAIGVGAAVVWLGRRLPERLPKFAVSGIFAVAFGVAAFLINDSTEFPPWAWAVVAGVGVTVVAATWFLPRTIDTRNYLTTTALAVLVLGATSGVTFVDGWSRWNYEGYEAKEPWPEYETLMATIDTLPEGRVMWEANREWNQFGTPMSPMLIPYWTEGTHQSMEGLYFESSLTTPFHFINHSEMSAEPSNPIPGLRYHTFDMERGLQHMGVYGVDYYVSFTPEAAEKAMGLDGFELITSTGRFSLFELPETDLVEVATHLPAVYEPSAASPDGEVTSTSFHEMALDWYEDIDDMDRVVTADGPTAWPRIETLDERPDVALEVPENAVSNIVLENHRLSFTTTAVGLPHVVKISYFPNWQATGAEGPWRATPSLMVVVPTQEQVVLQFEDTWPETGGKMLTVVGVIGLAAAGVVAVRVRRARADQRTQG